MTDVFNKMMVGDSAFVRAAARRVVTVVLRMRRLRLAIGGRLTGVGIAYPARERGEHAWTGRRMPDVDAVGGRLYELLRDGRFALLAPTGTSGVKEVGAHWSDRVRAVQVEAGAVADLPGVVLVRPDGYVAWASDSPTRGEIEAAISDWCGQATFARRPA